MNNKLVTIIIPTYKRSDMLDRAITSMLNQKTNFRFEIVIGDDCSTDNSPKIISDYASKYDCIVPILREKNIGATNNEIDTYCHCKGKYICVFDGDDFLIDDDKLQRQFDYLESHLEIFSIAARGKIADEECHILPYRHYNKIQIVRPETLGKLGEMPHIATFMMRNLFLNDNDRERIMSLIKKHSTIGDWTVLLFCLDKSDIIIFPEYVHCYRKIRRSDASNYSSIYKYQKNKYEVIVERMEYEQEINEFPFERLRTHYSVAKKAYNMWALIIKDRDKESRQYGKKLYNERMMPYMTKRQRMLVPLGIIKYYYGGYIKIAINKVKCYMQTRHELGTSI